MVRTLSKFLMPFAVCLLSVLTLLQSHVAFAGACQKTLAATAAEKMIRDHNHEAEWAIKSDSRREDLLKEILPFDPHMQARIVLLSDLLVGLPAQSLKFSSDFSTASFSFPFYDPAKGPVIQSSSFSLLQDRGHPVTTYLNFHAPNKSYTAVSSGSHSAFFLGSDVTPSQLVARIEDHMNTIPKPEVTAEAAVENSPVSKDTAESADKPGTDPALKAEVDTRQEQVEALTEAVDPSLVALLKNYTVESREAVIFDLNHSMAVGTQPTGKELYIFEIDFEKDGTPFVNAIMLRDAKGEAILLGSSQYPQLNASDFMFDPNTNSIAMKIPNADPKRPPEFNFLERHHELDSYLLTEKSFFYTADGLPFSHAFLPYSRTLAFRDPAGNFFIRHADKDLRNEAPLYKIPVPRSFAKRDAFGEDIAEALSFPKVVSIDDYEGGQFVILKRDGNFTIWDSVTGRARNIDTNKLFNEAEKKAKAPKDTLFPGLVEGVSIHSEGDLMAIWGENCIKIFDTVSSIELRKFTLAKEAHRGIDNVLFSPDGSALLISFKDGSAALFETRSGSWVQNFKGEIADQFAYGFAPYSLNYREALMPAIRQMPRRNADH